MVSLIPRMRRHARFMLNDADLADDLVQECLFRAVNKIKTWQPGTNLQAWMIMILRNIIINHWRRTQRRPQTVELAGDLAVRAGQEVHVEVIELRRAIQQLSREHREVLFLVAVEGWQHDDVAALLGVPVGTVRSRLFRARSAIRDLLGERHEQEGKPRRKAANLTLVEAAASGEMVDSDL
jgi:RNA polymerase sigma-70 factor (ECF subfamily)